MHGQSSTLLLHLCFHFPACLTFSSNRENHISHDSVCLAHSSGPSTFLAQSGCVCQLNTDASV